MLYSAVIHKSPCHHSQSMETLIRYGAVVVISPAFNNNTNTNLHKGAENEIQNNSQRN